ncbi:MAG: TetR/AcrR family transcriptional regulator [Candidatus Aminicenantes bacterium]|nr:MAG: TetR/AcrR family transcriptional regulator [Candidatus Aminicenantes bacterium]
MCARVVDKKEKKDQIVEAAIREFARKGFSKTTINDIANAAGIGKGTVYEYFSNKEEIVHETFRFFMHSMEPDFQAILISGIPAKEKLKNILNGFSRFISAEYRELTELMLEFWSGAIKDKSSKGVMFNEMIKFYNVYREIFADIIIEGMGDGSFRKDINPRSTAAMIVGTLDGLLVQWILERESIDFQDILKAVTVTVLNGIAAEK